MADDKPIIVVKKKGGHGGHHGGAWKIAYADFVTAMMAFFMVMWLVNSASVQTRQSIASYFRKPGIFTEGSGTPLLLGGAGILEDAFVPPKPEEKKRPKKKKVINQSLDPFYAGESSEDMDKEYMKEGNHIPNPVTGPTETTGMNSDDKKIVEVKKEIELKKANEAAAKELLAQLSLPDLSAILGALDIKVDADGLNIEIMDTDKTSMFESGSARIRLQAEAAIAKIAQVVKKFPNTLEIIGHTDAKPFPSRTGGYTNWELSADRANAARRIFEKEGFPPTQIGSVIGKASTQLKNTEDPFAAQNRRITLKIKFNLSQKIDVGKGDEGTKKLDEILSATPAAEPTASEEETVHSMSPEEVLNGKKEGDRKPSSEEKEAPPKSSVPTENPAYIEKDKIFNDNPVIGPAELYGR